MKISTRFLAAFAVLSLFFVPTWAQNSSRFLTPIDASKVPNLGKPQISAREYKTMQLDMEAIRSYLLAAPMEFTSEAANNTYLLQLPMPDGSLQEFDVEESPIMEKELADKFPTFKTYSAKGITDKTAYMRLSLTEKGFHAMVLSIHGTYYWDPYNAQHPEIIFIYDKKDYNLGEHKMVCRMGDNATQNTVQSAPASSFATVPTVQFGDCQRRNYRLALAATGEYSAFQGGTVSLALAAQVVSMNRVNGVYEREVGVHMNLVANNNLIVYTNASTDPYTNTNASSLLTQNQSTCNSVIGTANYDIGHVFSTGGGGLAALGCVCGSSKASAETGSSSPIADAYDIDYVAHEMGHQFGGNHTFSSSAGSCSGNGNAATAVETGSGITIMAYAGICTGQDVAAHSIDNFHSTSLGEMSTFITGSATCSTIQTITNNSPSITSSTGNSTIPKSTPFILTGAATDLDGDIVTYNWEQYDNSTGTQPPVSTNTGGPTFRCFSSTTSPTWYFPSLSVVTSGVADTWQVLPSVARTMKFRLTVRDNHAGNGCTNSAINTITVNGTAGPFVVTSPSTTGISYSGLSSQTVTWNVAGTTASPVSCANVDIYLSTDGGLTYPTQLASAQPNDGVQVVTLPNIATTTARIMVKANGNIFYDISDKNFSITQASNPDYTFSASPTPQTVCVGNTATYTVATQSVLGFSNSITLSAAQFPNGSAVSFNPNPVTPGSNSTMTVTGLTSASASTISIIGTATGTSTHTTTVDLTVLANPGTFSLSTPANVATGVSTLPTLTWTAASSATTYDLQIATNSGFTTGLQTITAIATNSYTFTNSLNPNTQYFWKVRAVNQCLTDAYSSAFSFTTANIYCSTFTSTDVPKAISATGTPTITSLLTFANAGTITDVNVTSLSGTHTWINDLVFTLISPAGTKDTLMKSVCSSEDNFDIKFDDATASLYASIPCPPVGALTFKPYSPLSAFNGQNINGQWQMVVKDNVSADGGALNAWALNVCYIPICNSTSTQSVTPTTCPTACNGASTITVAAGLAPYTYAWTGTTASTATASNLCTGSYSVIATDAQGCTTSQTFTINSSGSVPAQPATFTASTTTVCKGNAYTYTVPTVSGATSYTWTYSGTGASFTSTTNTVSVSFDNTATAGTLSVVANNACGSGTARSISLIIGNSPIAPIVFATNNPICAGTSTTLGSNVSTVDWFYNGSNTSFSSSSTPTVSSAGTYQAVNTTVCGSAASNIITLGVTALPVASTITAGGATTFCQGGSVTLSGNNGGIWSNGATTPSITVNAAGTYSVTTTNNCGSATSNAIAITVNPLPVASTITAGGATTFCQGGSVTLSGNNGGIWSNGATTPSITVNAAGTYSVTTTNNCGSATSNAIAVIVNPLPVVSTITAGGATTFCDGGSVTLSGNSGGIWSNGATTPSITVNAAGTYSVTTTNNCGSVTSNAVSVTVNPLPTASSITAAGNTTFCAGGSVTLLGNNGGTWNNGSTTPSITVNESGTYSVINTNNCGSATSNSISVTVNPLPTASIISAGGPTTFCEGGSVTLLGNNGGIWNNGATTPSITVSSINSFYVTTTNNCGSTTSNVIAVSVNSLPTPSTITAGGNTTFCAGGSVTLSGNTNGVWNTNVTTPSITVTSSGTYSVTTTNNCGSIASNSINVIVNPLPTTANLTASGATTFCSGGSVVLSGNDAGVWNTGATTASITVTTAGNYSVTNTNSCGSATSNSISVTVNPLPVAPTITAGGATTFCSGGSVTLSGNNGGIWSNGATTPSISVNAAGTYSVTTTNNCGSATSNAIAVSINSLPTASIVTAGGATTFCQGGSVTLSGNNGGIWSNGATTPSITVNAAGTYSVTTTNNCGSATSNAISVSINPLPTALTISAGGNTTFCAGGSVILLGNNGGVWSTGATTTSISVNAAGTYSVTTSNNCGSVTSNAIAVSVNSLPTASAITAGGATSFCSGGNVVLSGNNGGVWNTGATTPSITVSSAGTYSVTNTNNCGNITSNAIAVTVSPLPTASTITAGSATTFCSGNSVVLSGNNNGGVWSNGATTATTTVTTAGTYSVANSNSCGTATSNVINVVVNTCNGNTALTQLKTIYCGTTLAALNTSLNCVAVTGATQYEWEVTDIATGAVYIKLVASTSTVLSLASITSVTYAKTYSIRVRCLVAGVWGNFGVSCNVNTPAFPVIGLTAASCNVTLATLATLVNCTAVTGATNYEWELTDIVSGVVYTKLRAAAVASMAFSTITGVTFNRTYSTKVRALVGGVWGVFGTACNVTTPAPPLTNVIATQCGITLASIGTSLSCVAVPLATDYLWDFEESITGIHITKQRAAAVATLVPSTVAGLDYDKTYFVRVKSLVDGVWGSLGSACNVTTPPLGTTNVTTTQCGITLAAISTSVTCNAIPFTTIYEWQVMDSSLNVVYVKQTAATASLNLSTITGIRYNTIYTIRIRCFVNGVWSSFGSACNVTTPAVPLTKLVATQCGISVTTLATTLSCTAVTLATNYEWEFTDISNGAVITKLRGSSSASLVMNTVVGITNNKTYSIRIRPYVNGAWAVFGAACSVTTPTVVVPKFALQSPSLIGSTGNDKVVADIANQQSLLDVSIFPNPITDDLNLLIATFENENANVVITDIAGNVKFNDKVTTNSKSKIQNLELLSGVYFLTVTTIHGDRKTIKVLKQ